MPTTTQAFQSIEEGQLARRQNPTRKSRIARPAMRYRKGATMESKD